MQKRIKTLEEVAQEINEPEIGKFKSLDSYNTFLTNLKNKSAKDFNIELQPTDKILTLSTCDDTGKHRSVLHDKLIKISNK